jgi:chemotaxis protein MotA
MLDGNKFNPMEYIDTLVDFAQFARKNGLLALEEKARELEDPFFRQGIMLIVDATDPDRVRDMLNNDLDYLSDRHDEGAGLYEKASAMAPAFGMVGTLIGLVNMLKGMDMDSGGASTLGQDMSVALITTFYGVVLANLFFAPIGKKLRIRNNEEYLCKQIIIEGVLSIQSGENPKFLKEKLTSFLAQQQRESALGEEDGGGKKGKKKKK